jgi:zinc ribbon protein
MPLCQQCNAGLPPGAKFCGRCGAAVATPLDTGLTMPVAATPEPEAAAPPGQDWRSGSGLGTGGPVGGREEPTRAFGAPPQSPVGPAQGLTGPGQGAGSPTQDVGSPAQGFAGPAQGLGRHAQGAADPGPGLGTPAQSFGGPAQALGTPAQSFGGPGPDLGSPGPGLGSPAQGLGSPGPGLGGQPQGLGGLGFSGPAAGAAGPAQWQITPAAPARAVPQVPSQQGSASGQAIVGGVIAFLGAIGVIVACAVPLIKGPAGAGFGSTSVTLFNLLSHGPLKWFLAEPIGVAVLSVLAGLVIMSSRSRAVPAVAAGILIGIGIQTAALFFAIHSVVSGLVGGIVAGLGSLSGSGSTGVAALGIQTGPAGIVGLLGAVLLIVAGVVAGVAAARRA